MTTFKVKLLPEQPNKSVKVFKVSKEGTIETNDPSLVISEGNAIWFILGDILPPIDPPDPSEP